ncbi:MAG: GlsB/YeaQ/YmgE family stress response membrane protein [Christensenellales bacterium]
MGIIAWLLLGGFAGWIASIIMKKNESMGVFANVTVGIVGALIGGFIMSLIGRQDVMGFNIESLLIAVLGSIVLLSIVNLIRKGSVR